ncbi:EAL domain-containing protein [Uliginosibacterium sp. 31-16]|uniref:sensor domain-containing phosphodiesterase n=1 Tax=Uliginosibacterium sp. 31-16 TaxID=3068315 RepID=UPI00273EEF20|nr:EAL domain-containing protein [Uliginosibacterium sp. 31-16]MDP5239442.1 EAL domain-containing protein [Uliginosibacterium sp. 31-16]
MGNEFLQAARTPARAWNSRMDDVPEILKPYLANSEWRDGQLQLNWQQHRLSSAFQPIVSFSHSRIVAHEALLRAVAPSGRPVSPPELFGSLETTEDVLRLDRTSRMMHILNVCDSPGWFFLNLHPELFGSLLNKDSLPIAQAIGEFVGVSPSQFVIELVEEEITDHIHFEEGVAALRALGLGVALDDFGAGHSNFDRVWKIRPDVVKLDRSFAARAEADRSVRRLLPQIVGILHEAGTLVLLEGIETLEQARIAMDSNIDFGQGWYFARPAPAPLQDPLVLKPTLDAVWDQQSKRADQAWDARRRIMAPYLEAISCTAQRIAEGASLEDAADAYLGLPHVACLYMLDDAGLQVGRNLNAPTTSRRRVTLGLGHMSGARWSRRAYFIRAMHDPGKPQSTRPYLSVATGNICVTVSIQVEVDGRPFVVCGDVDWDELEAASEV